MRAAIVTLDIETTGFDPRRDQVIEIGAVRSAGGEELDSFQSFVNPGRPIPAAITELTGIADEHVAGAAPAAVVLPEFAAFAGDHLLLAHNANFDLGFLRAGGILRENAALDTVALAQLMLPEAPRYGLGALAEQLGIAHDEAHRALADARATSTLYWRLWQRACSLPMTTLRELCGEAGKQPAWAPARFFAAALAEAETGNGRWRKPENLPHLADQPAPAISAHSPPASAIDIEVQAALRARESLLLETGAAPEAAARAMTAAAARARGRNERVLLVANREHTLNALREAAQGLAAEGPLRWSEAHAPADLLCGGARATWQAIPPLDASERQFRARLLIWLALGGSGRRRDFRLRGPAEQAFWRRISAEHCQCEELDRCPGLKAQYENANSQLLISSMAAWADQLQSDDGNRSFADATIVADARELEQALTENAEACLEKECLTRPLRALVNKRRGLLSRRNGTRFHPDFTEALRGSARAFRSLINEIFSALEECWQAQAPDGSWLPLTPALRLGAAFTRAATAGRRLRENGSALTAALERMADGLTEQRPGCADALFLRILAAEWQGKLAEFARVLLDEGDEDARWLERNRWSASLQLRAAPVRPARAIAGRLAAERRPLILLDDSLSAGDGGEFWQERMALPLLSYRDLGESVDDEYGGTLVVVPQDLPPPNERHAYQRALERSLLQVASKGEFARAVAIFTSYAHLRETATALRPRMKLGGIPVFEGLQRAPFLGETRGIWLIGWRDWSALALPPASVDSVLLARLPFELPNQPLVAARTAQYDDGFGEYSVKIACQRMRAALRRARQVSGPRCAFVIADSRVIHKRYGEQFIASLPTVELRYRALAGLGEELADWLRGGG